ncbi:MAG: glycosyltransferase [Burkholderiales bacterium]|nr:glycosyltransferase [Burkholderiales bacterium]
MLVTYDQCLFVVIAYNPNDDILNLLTSLEQLNKLVIDNSETDIDWLQKYCLSCGSLYWSENNIGIAAALNNAARYAIELGYKYIVSLDQDSQISSLIIEKLIYKLNQLPNQDLIATISPKHISQNVSIQLGSDSLSDGIFGLQSANFINLNIWKSISGFDENLFIDMVDTDYYIRAKLSGYNCFTCNDIHMIHQVGTEVKEIKILGKYIRAFNHSYIRKYYQARNFMYIYRKYQKVYPEVVYFFKVILTMPFTILLFEDNKFKKLKYFFCGILDCYRNKMGKFIK